MALSASEMVEEERELTIEELLAKSGARLPATHLKRAFVGHTAVPSQKEVDNLFSSYCFYLTEI